ncbi:unnamed protein product [Malus baccata var. baccata]
MNHLYVHGFPQHAFDHYFPDSEEDDNVEECPSYGYDENHMEPTYELPTYGYTVGGFSSPMEFDCWPTNGYQLNNNNLKDWPTYGYDKKLLLF